MRPLTFHMPKVLVPIGGRPLLSYWLENLSHAKIEKFLLNTHYLHEQIEAFVESSPYKERIELAYEGYLLSTGGAAVANESFFQNEPFMLVHADNLSFCDFGAFIDSHAARPKGCEITMMLFRTDTPQSCGIVELDQSGVVQAFHEKVQNPPSNLANGAVYICEPSVIEFMRSLGKEDVDFSLDVLPHYMGRINTFLNDVYHRDIGTPLSYAKAQEEIAGLRDILL